MDDRTLPPTNRRVPKPRRRSAMVAAIAGLAVLVAGCAGAGLMVSASSPSHGAGTSPSVGGAGGAGGASGAAGLGGAGGTGANPNVPQANPNTPQSHGFVSPAKENSGADSRSGVTGGALFGGNGPLVREDARLGRKLAIVREYYRIGESFPTPPNRRLMESGSTLVVSLDSAPGHGGPSYASIADGHEDGVIGAFLKAMNQAAVTYHLGAIYFCFEHEADNPRHLALGSPAEFVKAWDHLHQLAQSDHLNWNDGGRLHWVLILEHTAYQSAVPRWESGGGASAYWPGDKEVDIVAADGYNHIGCQARSRAGGGTGTTAADSKWLTPEALFDPVLSFAHSHGGLPVFITEWGSQASYAASEQPTFIGQMRSFVSANHEVAAALYFDWKSAQYPRCNNIINNLPPSLSAMAAMGHSADLQGRLLGA
jgi:hypothetical protein